MELRVPVDLCILKRTSILVGNDAARHTLMIPPLDSDSFWECACLWFGNALRIRAYLSFYGIVPSNTFHKLDLVHAI